MITKISQNQIPRLNKVGDPFYPFTPYNSFWLHYAESCSNHAVVPPFAPSFILPRTQILLFSMLMFIFRNSLVAYQTLVYRVSLFLCTLGKFEILMLNRTNLLYYLHLSCL